MRSEHQIRRELHIALQIAGDLAHELSDKDRSISTVLNSLESARKMDEVGGLAKLCAEFGGECELAYFQLNPDCLNAGFEVRANSLVTN